MTESEVPKDFPADSGSYALGGAQPKFNAVKDIDGKYRQPGDTVGGRLERYERCRAVVDWALGKAAKPKYAQVEVATLLAKLKLNLAEDFDLSVKEQQWVLDTVASDLAKFGRS